MLKLILDHLDYILSGKIKIWPSTSFTQNIRIWKKKICILSSLFWLVNLVNIYWFCKSYQNLSQHFRRLFPENHIDQH